MAKEKPHGTTELAPYKSAVGGGGEMDVVRPAWLAPTAAPAVGEGVEYSGEFRQQTRLKIVQHQTKSEELRDLVGEGGVCIVPTGIPVATIDEEFIVIPFCFCPTWEQWADYNDKNTPMVVRKVNIHTRVLEWGEQMNRRTGQMERVPVRFDEIYLKAKDPARRSEQYPIDKNTGRPPCDPKTGKPYCYSFVECLNYMVLIDSGPAAGEVTTLTYCRGGWKLGEAFNRQVRAAAKASWDLWTNRFALHSEGTRSQNDEPYYWLPFNNPSPEQANPADHYQLDKDGKPITRFIGRKLRVGEDGQPIFGEDGKAIVEDWGRLLQLQTLHDEAQAAYDANKFSVYRDDEGGDREVVAEQNDDKGDHEIPI